MLASCSLHLSTWGTDNKCTVPRLCHFEGAVCLQQNTKDLVHTCTAYMYMVSHLCEVKDVLVRCPRKYLAHAVSCACEWFLSCLCSKALFKFLLWPQHLLHWQHTNGFSFVWLLKCTALFNWALYLCTGCMYMVSRLCWFEAAVSIKLCLKPYHLAYNTDSFLICVRSKV